VPPFFSLHDVAWTHAYGVSSYLQSPPIGEIRFAGYLRNMRHGIDFRLPTRAFDRRFSALLSDWTVRPDEPALNDIVNPPKVSPFFFSPPSKEFTGSTGRGFWPSPVVRFLSLHRSLTIAEPPFVRFRPICCICLLTSRLPTTCDLSVTPTNADQLEDIGDILLVVLVLFTPPQFLYDVNYFG